eukprot:6479502-Amphidinium_carterae.1
MERGFFQFSSVFLGFGVCLQDLAKCTVEGCAEFEQALAEAAQEFHTSYVPYLLEQKRDMEEKRKRAVEEQLRKFDRDRLGAIRSQHTL